MSSSSSIQDLRQQKQALRQIMQARRIEAQRQNPEAPLALRDLFLQSITRPANSIIAYYLARGAEMNPDPLAKALRIQGHTLCLPVVTGKDQPLCFRAYTQGDTLVHGAMSLPEPAPTLPLAEPDILLVPLLAFDRQGYRLGYGGGYYDRTLTNLRRHKNILAVGIAYVCQEVPHVPIGPLDVPLDRIITEIETF